MKYIEDLVEQFGLGRIHVSNFDEKISQSLANQIFNGKAFTHKQADIALRLVKKYRNQFKKIGVTDIENMLETPIYKFNLRTIDNTKSVTLDPISKRFIIKFPFDQNLLTLFRTLNTKEKLTRAEWDPDNKNWTLDLNEVSLAFILDNLSDSFVIDDEIKNYIDKYNQIKDEFENFVPTLIKENDSYKFKNIKSDFETNDLKSALIESTKLGVHIYADNVADEISELIKLNSLYKIYEQSHNQKFFIDKAKHSRTEVLSLIKEMNVNTAVFVDENISADTLNEWVSDLINVGVSLDQIGVFFRRKNEEDGVTFNKVIKDFGLNKEASSAPNWVFLSNKFPKSLLKNHHNIDVCLFVNRYVTSHYSIINTVKNSIFSLQYNEHKSAEADIVNL